MSFHILFLELVDGMRFESRCDLAQSGAGRLLSIGALVANVIRTPCLLLHASNQYIHVSMYVCWEVCQLLAEGQRFPPSTPVSSANKIDRHDMT